MLQQQAGYCSNRGERVAMGPGSLEGCVSNERMTLLHVVEAADIGSLADHVAFHALHDFVARGVRGQIQLRVERVELPHVVMERARAGPRTEVARSAAASTDARTVARAVRKITSAHAFRQTLRGTRDVERSPVQSVRGALGCRVFDVVEDYD